MGHGVSPEVYRLAETNPPCCRLFGRLRDGFTREQTRQALVAAARIIGGPDFAKQVSVLRPMAGLAAHENSIGDDRRYFVFFVALFGTALMLAVIACFNVAGLLLARGVTRQRELAIRKALGASRFQLARHLLAEGFVLVVLGAGAGLIVDAFLRNWLSYVRWPSAYNLPFEFHFQNDRGLFLYALATALAALLVSSLLPSLRGVECRSRPRDETGRARVLHPAMEPAEQLRRDAAGVVDGAANARRLVLEKLPAGCPRRSWIRRCSYRYRAGLFARCIEAPAVGPGATAWFGA